MSPNPTLRPAAIADLAAVTDCTRRAYRIYVERLGYEPKPMLADYSDAASSGLVWVLEQDGATVGALVLDALEDHLLIYSVAVIPENQGQGHGRRMMDFAEAEARRRGLSEVRLYTNERMTENQRFYTSLGYETFARRAHATQPNSWAIHMRKGLLD